MREAVLKDIAISNKFDSDILEHLKSLARKHATLILLSFPNEQLPPSPTYGEKLGKLKMEKFNLPSQNEIFLNKIFNKSSKILVWIVENEKSLSLGKTNSFNISSSTI